MAAARDRHLARGTVIGQKLEWQWNVVYREDLLYAAVNIQAEI